MTENSNMTLVEQFEIILKALKKIERYICHEHYEKWKASGGFIYPPESDYSPYSMGTSLSEIITYQYQVNQDKADEQLEIILKAFKKIELYVYNKDKYLYESWKVGGLAVYPIPMHLSLSEIIECLGNQDEDIEDIEYLDEE